MGSVEREVMGFGFKGRLDEREAGGRREAGEFRVCVSVTSAISSPGRNFELSRRPVQI